MVLPIGDRNPTRRAPVITVAVLVVNVGVFFLVQPHEGCAANAFLFEWAAIPRELLSFEALSGPELRAILGPACAATIGAKSVPLSAVTAMFLHANLGHLAGNMLFLWVFGNNVEDRLGHGRFVLFYLVGGAAATYAFAALHPGTAEPLLGASGAIAAILGAYAVCYPRALVHTYVPFPLYLVAPVIPRAKITGWFLIFAIVTLPAWLVLVAWFALQVLSARSPAAAGVAFEAHIAGFVAGIVLLLLLDRRRRRRGRPTFHPPRRAG